MSEAYTKGGNLATETCSQTEDFGAEKVSSNCDQAQKVAVADIPCRYAAHWLRDIRLRLFERKVGSYFCKSPSWRESVGKPLRRYRSLDSGSRGDETLTTLPHLFHNLSVSRTRSDPCIFGKDLLTITLPVPGEPKECEMNNIPVEGVFCGRIPSEVFAPSIMVDNREGRSNCFQLCRAHGFEESINQGLAKVDSNSDSEHLQYVHSSVIHNATTPIFDNTEESAMRASKTDSDVATKDFPGTNVNNLDNPYYKNTFIGNEVVGSEDYSSQKIHDFRGALNDEILEDDEDEGYVLKDEDKIDGSSDNDSYHDFHGKSGPEQFGNDMSEFAKCSLGRDVFTEDESWSEEPYVSSQARYFPPPISILANENQPGLPSHVPKTLWRSVKRDGRFILQEVQARPREFFQAIRECGRLKLQLVRLESDSSGSSFDSASPEDGEDFFFSNESVDSTNALPQIDQQVESYDAVASMTAEQNSQSVVGRLALKICNHVTENDVSARHNPIGKDSEMHLQPLAPSALLTDKADDILQAACSDAKFEHGVGSEMNQRTSAASIVLRESASQVGSDVGETPFSTEHNVTVEKRLGEPVIDEGFGRNSNYVMVA